MQDSVVAGKAPSLFTAGFANIFSIAILVTIAAEYLTGAKGANSKRFTLSKAGPTEDLSVPPLLHRLGFDHGMAFGTRCNHSSFSFNWQFPLKADIRCGASLKGRLET